MNKFLWFLGGCATGLLAAAAISVLNESCESSTSGDDDSDANLETDEAPAEEAPIFPGQHFKAASGFFANAFPQGCGAGHAGHVDEDSSNASDASSNQS